MKKIILLSIGFFASWMIDPARLLAQQVTIGNGGPSQDGSAMLELKSTDKGILLPRMTAAQRAAISNPAKGLLIFQTDGSTGFYYYDGHLWINLASGLSTNNEGVSESYGLSTLFAGSTYGYANGIDTAKFKRPVGITLDRIGNIYIADADNHNIRKATSLGVVTLVAGMTVAGYVDGPAETAAFNQPSGITVDANGNLYIADRSNNRIRKITAAGAVTLFAGHQLPGSQDGNGSNARFASPTGIVSDAAGNLYVADTDNHNIRKITPAADVTTLAGSSAPGFTNGTGTAASFNKPAGLTLDGAGNIYVADTENHCIRKITPAGVVTTFAGTGAPGSGDGTVATATFNLPKAIAIDTEGNFYIADAGNHSIRKITPDGIVSTIAGAGVAGNADGQSATAFFNDPSGLVADMLGNLYVTDSGNSVIRKIIIR